MKKFRKGKQRAIKGITLISLVITIIILVILTGISINLISNKNGLFNIAKQEGINNLEKQIEKLNKGLPKNTKGTEAGTEVKIPSEWITTTSGYIETENEGIVEKVLVASTVNAIATGNGETVPVPKGFYYVGGTISSGVVISDNADDQNKYAGQTDVPAGVIYNEDGTVKTYTDEEYKNLSNEEKQKVLLGNQFVWIPITEENYKKIDWNKVSGNDYDNATWETQTHSSELTQIRKYGGFYVGRYEAGTSEITISTGTTTVDFSEAHTASTWQNTDFSIRDELSNHTATGNITSKAGEIPYYHADYFTALELSNRMYQTDYVQSGLITGTMWDAIIKFIAGDETSIVTTASTWGNYNAATDGVIFTTGQGRYATVDSNNGSNEAFTVADDQHHYGIRTTASTEGVKQKNLYDIAGNLWEWTQEAAYINDGLERYMRRGGTLCNDYFATPACHRICSTPAPTNTDNGFRPALFIM